MEIKTLTKEVTAEYSKEIIELHNVIPFQKWIANELFLESDDTRIFKFKWEISSACFVENNLIGFCIAFEDNHSKIQGVLNFLYLHRIVVNPEYRFRGIGRDMIRYTCKNFQTIKTSKIDDTSILVLTPISSVNNISFVNAEEFYLKLGFKRVGDKIYKNKVDAILTARLIDIIH